MKIFLSWSGSQSKQVADTLGEWLSQVIQAVEPWISSDIDKGARWSLEVATQLEQADFGIICLTKENLTAPWLLFEAGALAKHRDGRVCTFLLDVAPTDVKQPLAQFQATSLSKSEVLSLVQTINERMNVAGEKALAEGVLLKMVERLWPDLEKDLERIKSQQPNSSSKTKRTSEDVMVEVLATVRRMESMLQTAKSPLQLYFAEDRDQKEQMDNAERMALLQALVREQSLKVGAKGHPERGDVVSAGLDSIDQKAEDAVITKRYGLDMATARGLKGIRRVQKNSNDPNG